MKTLYSIGTVKTREHGASSILWELFYDSRVLHVYQKGEEKFRVNPSSFSPLENFPELPENLKLALRREDRFISGRIAHYKTRQTN